MPANWPSSLDKWTSCNTQINPAAASSQPTAYRQLRKMDFPEFRAEESVISASTPCLARFRLWANRARDDRLHIAAPDCSRTMQPMPTTRHAESLGHYCGASNANSGFNHTRRQKHCAQCLTTKKIYI